MTLPSEEKIIALLDAIEVSIRNAIALNSLINTLNESDELSSAADNTFGVHGLNITMQSYIENLLLILSRLLDRGPDVASLSILMEKFKQHPGLIDRYAKQAENWTLDQSEWVKLKLHKTIQEYDDLLESEDFSNMRKILKDFRNTYLAHTLMRGEIDKPEFYYLDHMTVNLVPIYESMRNCITGGFPNYEDYVDVRNKYSNDFLKVLIAGFKSQS